MVHLPVLFFAISILPPKMSIEITCPQGHKIACGEELIGKSVKCPSCETVFRITDPRGSQGGKSADRVEQDNTIAFLCPNGHKLNSPASLQGKAGKCPHCGERFLIPDYSEDDNDDLEDLTADSDDVETNELPVLEDLQPLDGLSADQEAEDLPEAANPIALQQTRQHDPFAFVEAAATFDDIDTSQTVPMPVTAVGLHPMALLFETLWARRTPEMPVELQLNSGEKLCPDHFAVELSRQYHGIFAVKRNDGTYSISAIVWDAIQQVTLQHVRELPFDIFPH